MGASIALGVSIMHENIMAAPTALERAKRGFLCLQAFALTFFLLNYNLLLAPRHATIMGWSNSGEATRAVIWGILSCLLSLWMSIWVSTLYQPIISAGGEGAALGDERRGGRSARSEVEMTAAREAALHIAEETRWEGTSDEETCCPICMDPFESRTAVRVTQCRHVFCSTCLGAFIAGAAEPGLLACPMCRTTLVERQQRAPSPLPPTSSVVANAPSATVVPASLIAEP